jgi:hypothetical protein
MGIKATKVAPELQLEIEQYYYREAELLDDHRYAELARALLQRRSLLDADAVESTPART